MEPMYWPLHLLMIEILQCIWDFMNYNHITMDIMSSRNFMNNHRVVDNCFLWVFYGYTINSFKRIFKWTFWLPWYPGYHGNHCNISWWCIIIISLNYYLMILKKILRFWRGNNVFWQQISLWGGLSPYHQFLVFTSPFFRILTKNWSRKIHLWNFTHKCL